MMRLDLYLVTFMAVPSRSKAVHLIKSGNVLVNEKIVVKTAYQVKEKDNIKLQESFSFVGRGGYKIADFIKDLSIPIENQIALDVGCSTGGFTDYLLQQNVQRVVAIDIGNDILDKKLQVHHKVEFYGGIDATDPKLLASCLKTQKFQLITVDVTGVPLILILNNIEPYLEAKSNIIALLKPQYEKADNRKNLIKITDAFEKSLVNKFHIISKKLCAFRGGIKQKGVQEFFYWLKKE